MTLADVCVVSKLSYTYRIKQYLYQEGTFKIFFKALVILQMIYEYFTHVL